MKKNTAPPAGGIADRVEIFSAFAADLREFLGHMKESDLFEDLPEEQTPTGVSRRLDEGHPLIRPASYRLREEACGEAFFGMLDLAKQHMPDREAGLREVEKAYTRAGPGPADFLSRVFLERGEDLLQEAEERGMDSDLVTFLAVYAARPFRESAARALTADLDLRGWQRGCCPVCGHGAALSHIFSDGGARTLWCVHCATRWVFKRLQCARCLTEDQSSLQLLGPEAEPAFGVQVCSACGRYLKEIRSTDPADRFGFDAANLGTYVLDEMAVAEGFAPEALLALACE